MLRGLAWAAQGVNRPESGLRTAPSWHGAADTRVHLAEARGVRSYETVSDDMVAVSSEDIRGRLSPQPFVASAPVVLIYSSDVDAMPTDAPREQKMTAAMVDAAIVAQNAYLFCAAEGLGTCLVGGIDADANRAAVPLGSTIAVTFVQPVGWPARQGL
jgi:nitroreductase